MNVWFRAEIRAANKPPTSTASLSSAIEEWSLPSEPWLFLIDEQGIVVERYEGGIGLTELDPAVAQLVT